MIRSISIEGFKCYEKKTKIPLSQINILYGKNGRGKSTLIQILLLLSQTIRKGNDLNILYLMDDLIHLGTFQEILNICRKEKNFSWDLESEKEHVEMEFSEYPSKVQLAKLSKLVVDGDDRFSVKSNAEADVSTYNYVTSTSDVSLLQNLKSLLYVSANRIGPNNSSQRKDSLDAEYMGVNGEYVINVLANKGREFQNEVQNALSDVLTGASLKVSNESSEIIELFLNSVNGDSTFRPINVGFGYSYVLPVIVAALLSKKNSIFIVENPEAHLHPAAQSNLMKFLIKVAKQKNLQLFIETHSDHVVNGMRIAMKQKLENIIAENGEVLFFSHDDKSTKPNVEIIRCDEKGELDKYPDDFLDEWTKQLLNLI